MLKALLGLLIWQPQGRQIARRSALGTDCCCKPKRDRDVVGVSVNPQIGACDIAGDITIGIA